MADSGENVTPQCDTGNDYNGDLGIRISAIFVILVGSSLGAWFPTFAKRHNVGLPEWAFFVAKYFGSGVIIATAFIHLLAPANDALTNDCLTGPITDYDWVEGIALMTVFVMFVLELMTIRYAHFGEGSDRDQQLSRNGNTADSLEAGPESKGSNLPGDDHLGHVRDHKDNEDVPSDWQEGDVNIIPETFSAQLTSVFILEFGVIFHSIFVGLTLAVQGDGFNILYVVIVFHQTFEGLGLGSRLAMVPWPKSKRWTPYVLALAYGLTTPIAIAIGLGVRETFAPESQNTLIINGVFDSISAGILLYTGLIELMAHEFMFSSEMRRAPLKTLLSALLLMAIGIGLMALLGKWA